MKLYYLISDILCRTLGDVTKNISGLYHVDTEVRENGLFFCLRGTRVDGNAFVSSAVKNGAVAIVTEQEIPGLFGVTQVIVKNAREAMSVISCRFFGNPADKLKVVGVTGTNGKTTVSTVIFKSLINLGKKCALIGTNGAIIDGKNYETNMTTPDPIVLQKLFQIMVRHRVEYAVMEVSAHALDQCKIDGMRFSQVIFTNLSEDHLDYFKTMDKYFKAKVKLFSKKYADFAIVNADDENCEALVNKMNGDYAKYGIENCSADVVGKRLLTGNNGQMFEINGTLPKYQSLNGKIFETKLFGKFNIYNMLAVVLSLLKFGYPIEKIQSAIKNVEPVPGRFNFIDALGKKVVIDYAHTPDGLKNIILSCREISNNGKIIVVFGCGGNRDENKRHIMGEIADKLADFSVITTDNPRFENKNSIISDIVSGFSGSNYKVVIDRAQAIKFALENASIGDVIIIAGKGVENYIEENGMKKHFSDREEVEKYISKIKK